MDEVFAVAGGTLFLFKDIRVAAVVVDNVTQMVIAVQVDFAEMEAHAIFSHPHHLAADLERDRWNCR